MAQYDQTSTSRIRPSVSAVARITPTISATGRIAPIISATGSIIHTISATGRIAPIISATGSIIHTISATGRIVPTISATGRIAPTISSVARIQPTISAVARINFSIPGTARIASRDRDSKFYAIGGYDAVGYSQKNECLDVFNNTWTSKAPLVTPRTKLAVATNELNVPVPPAINGETRIYSFGGLGEPKGVSEYEVENDTWITKNNMTYGLYSLGAASIVICQIDLDNPYYAEGFKSLIHVLGGKDSATNAPKNYNSEYDPNADTWITRVVIPVNRSSFGCGSINNTNVYVVGGENGLDTTYTYNPLTESWSLGGTLTLGRHELATTGTVESLYVFGGNNVLGISQNDVYKYDGVVWIAKTPSTIRRARHTSSLCLEDYEKIIVAGGLEVPASCTTGTPTQLTESYDVAADSWIVKANMSAGRMDLGSGFVKGARKARVYQSITARANIQPSLKFKDATARVQVQINGTFNELGIIVNDKVFPNPSPINGIRLIRFSGNTISGTVSFKVVKGVETVSSIARIYNIARETLSQAKSWPTTSVLVPTSSIYLQYKAFGDSYGIEVLVSDGEYVLYSSDTNYWCRVKIESYKVVTNLIENSTEVIDFTAVARISPIISANAYIVKSITTQAWIQVLPIITASARIIRSIISAVARISRQEVSTIEATALIGYCIRATATVIVDPRVIRCRARIDYKRLLEALGRIRPRILSRGRIRPVTTSTAWIIAIHSRFIDAVSRIRPIITAVSRIRPSIPSTARVRPSIAADAKIVIWPTIKGNTHIFTELMEKGKLYVVGGWKFTYDNKVRTNECYEGLHDSWTVETPITSKRAQHGIGSSELQVTFYSIGGTGTLGVENQNLEYNPDTNSWAVKTGLVLGRKNNGVTNSTDYNGYEEILSIGGRDLTGSAIGNVDSYDPANDAWTSKASITPTDRLEVCTIQSNVSGEPRIYATGGEVALKGTKEFNPYLNSWTTKTDMIAGRMEHTSSASKFLGFNLVNAIGGINNLGQTLDSIELYIDFLDVWITDTVILVRDRSVSESINTNIVASSSPSSYIIGGGDYRIECVEYLAGVSLTFKTAMPTGRADAAVGFVRGLLYIITSQSITTNARIRPIITASAFIVQSITAEGRIRPRLLATGRICWNVPLDAIARVRPVIVAAARIRGIIRSIARVRPIIVSVARVIPTILAKARIRPIIVSIAKIEKNPSITSTAKLVRHTSYRRIYSRAKISKFISVTINAAAEVWPSISTSARIQPTLSTNGRVRKAVNKTINAVSRIRLVIAAIGRIIPSIKANGRIRPIITSIGRIKPSIKARGRIRPVISSIASIVDVGEGTINASGRIIPSISAKGRICYGVSKVIVAKAYIRMASVEGEAFGIDEDIG